MNSEDIDILKKILIKYVDSEFIEKIVNDIHIRYINLNFLAFYD
jgi:hypothetical protein